VRLRDRIAAHPAVEEISDEREPGDRAKECDGDGIWVYLADGWHNYEDREQPTSCVHAWSWTTAYSELLRYVRGDSEPRS
jgi:hypothetical protein